MLIYTETESGKRSMFLGGTEFELAGERNEITHVRAEAYIEDRNGGRRSLGRTGFTLDPSTVYVSVSSAGGDGSREEPFSDLAAGLEEARRLGSRSICLSGDMRLSRTMSLGGGLSIRGSYNGAWEKTGEPLVISLEQGASIRVGRGGLNIEGIKLERRSSPGPVFYIEGDGELSLLGVSLVHDGVFALLDEGGTLNLEDSSVSAFSAASRREALIRSTNSRIYVERSSLSLEGNYGLMFEMTGGSLFIKDSSLCLDCLKTGTILSLNGAKGEFLDAGFLAEAGDFASVLESKNVPLLARNCVFQADARDAALVSLETESLPPDETFLFVDSSFMVNSSFVARAMEIRGIFPSVSGCVFRYEGSARNAEVFSLVRETGSPPLLPSRGLIGGNSFEGFRLIMGRDYPAERLELFNRLFAPQGRDNTGAGPEA